VPGFRSQAPVLRLLKTSGLYQGIALAMPQVAGDWTALNRGWGYCERNISRSC
jgi:hypothetical protein